MFFLKCAFICLAFLSNFALVTIDRCNEEVYFNSCHSFVRIGLDEWPGHTRKMEN